MASTAANKRTKADKTGQEKPEADNSHKPKGKTIPLLNDDEPNQNPLLKLERYLLAKYHFRYNEVVKEVEYRHINSGERYLPLDEERELPEIRIDLARKGFKGYKTHLTDLVRTRSFSPSFHPFQNYFASLPAWKEGDTDYIAELCKYIRVKDQGWFNLMLKKHLVRIVACGLRKLEFNKHCFVLQSNQNDGKSFFIRFLCPPLLKEYYKENPPLDHKDSVIALGQNLIINLDELHGFNNADANKVKSLFSQTDVKVRLHYDKKDTLQPRHASFFGTINETEFLNDVTGNVRWLVFEVEEIIHDQGGEKGYVGRININDVWSQAYGLMNAGYGHQLNRQEVEEVNKRNRAYEKTFPEKELLETYFTPSSADQPNAYFVTPTDLLLAVQYMTRGGIKLNSVMMGKALKVLGFYRTKKHVYGYWVQTGKDEISEYFRNVVTILPSDTIQL